MSNELMKIKMIYEYEFKCDASVNLIMGVTSNAYLKFICDMCKIFKAANIQKLS